MRKRICCLRNDRDWVRNRKRLPALLVSIHEELIEPRSLSVHTLTYVDSTSDLCINKFHVGRRTNGFSVNRNSQKSFFDYFQKQYHLMAMTWMPPQVSHQNPRHWCYPSIKDNLERHKKRHDQGVGQGGAKHLDTPSSHSPWNITRTVFLAEKMLEDFSEVFNRCGLCRLSLVFTRGMKDILLQQDCVSTF